MSYDRGSSAGTVPEDESSYSSDPSWDSLHNLRHAGSSGWLDQIRPPGDFTVEIDGMGSQPRASYLEELPKARHVLSKSCETTELLPVLTAGQLKEAQRYFYCTQAAAFPFCKNASNKTDKILLEKCPNIRDAFQSTIGEDDLSIMPQDSYLSGFVNRSTREVLSSFYKHDDSITKQIPGPGEIHNDFMTHLSDPSTGLSGSIFYDEEKREVIIAFSALGSAGMGVRQFLQCVINVCGFGVPKNMVQASNITRIVHEHIKKLNQELTSDSKISLTVVGHSMGGALASYAALENKVPGVAINPMRLGAAVRQKLGNDLLENANKYLVEIVSPRDWVADNPASVAYKPLEMFGFSSRGAVGTATRLLLLANPQCNLAHSDVISSLKNLEAHGKAAEDLFSEFRQNYFDKLSDKARLQFIQGKISSAVFEALSPKMTLKDVEDSAKVRSITAYNRNNERLSMNEPVLKAYETWRHASRIAALQQEIYNMVFHANFNQKCNHDHFGRYIEPEPHGFNYVALKPEFKKLHERLLSEFEEYEIALTEQSPSDLQNFLQNLQWIKNDMERYINENSLASAFSSFDIGALMRRRMVRPLEIKISKIGNYFKKIDETVSDSNGKDRRV